MKERQKEKGKISRKVKVAYHAKKKRKATLLITRTSIQSADHIRKKGREQVF